MGTTTVTVYADGPDGGSPEIPDGLVPEEVLTGADLENWNALKPEFKAIILHDFIPEIPERAPDPSHYVSTLASLVAVMLDIQEQRQRREAADAARSGGGGSTQTPGVAGAGGASRLRCEFSARIDSAGAVSSLHCRATMARINAYFQVGRLATDTLTGRADETCWGCSTEWARVYESPPNPCHRRHANGSGTPDGYEPNGPYPEYHRYSGEHSTVC